MLQEIFTLSYNNNNIFSLELELNQQPFENTLFYYNTNSYDRYQKLSIHKYV